MRSRGIVVVLALILATLATVGVFLYSKGVKQDALESGDRVAVVVSKVDIAANTDLNTLIEQDEFELQELPADAVIEDAITEISQLADRRNTVFIVAGEQIALSRVEGGQVPGGQLGIPAGHQAITVALNAPRAIAGALAGGDNVTIYATFSAVDISLLEPNLAKFVKQARTTTTGVDGQVEIPKFDTTVVLVPEVEVLRVIREVQSTDVPAEQQTADIEGAISVTMAFLPEEAQKFVYSLELGSVYLSLLPPDEAGVDLDPLTVAEIILPQKQK
jgi:Flp pilus assembly protein CpaB